MPEDEAVEIGWDEVRARRLARSSLTPRASSDELVEVVGAVCGVHAQVQTSAELQLAARVEAGKRLIDPQEHLLAHVLGECLVTRQHAGDVVQQRHLVLAHDHSKRTLVSVPCEP